MAELRLVLYARTGDSRVFERWMLSTSEETTMLREFQWLNGKLVSVRHAYGDGVPWPR